MSKRVNRQARRWVSKPMRALLMPDLIMMEYMKIQDQVNAQVYSTSDV